MGQVEKARGMRRIKTTCQEKEKEEERERRRKREEERQGETDSTFNFPIKVHITHLPNKLEMFFIVGDLASPRTRLKTSGTTEAKVTKKSKRFQSSDQKLLGSSKSLRKISHANAMRMNVSACPSICIVLSMCGGDVSVQVRACPNAVLDPSLDSSQMTYSKSLFRVSDGTSFPSIIAIIPVLITINIVMVV